MNRKSFHSMRIPIQFSVLFIFLLVRDFVSFTSTWCSSCYFFPAFACLLWSIGYSIIITSAHLKRTISCIFLCSKLSFSKFIIIFKCHKSLSHAPYLFCVIQKSFCSLLNGAEFIIFEVSFYSSKSWETINHKHNTWKTNRLNTNCVLVGQMKLKLQWNQLLQTNSKLVSFTMNN